MPVRAASGRHPVRTDQQAAVAVSRSSRRRARSASRPMTRPGYGRWRGPAAPVPSGRQRRSSTRRSDWPRFSASHSVVARSSGRAKPAHRRYHTGRGGPLPARCRRSWRRLRTAMPALAAGIYLNAGSVGPLPAETAAAMADIADCERDVGRAHPDYFTEFTGGWTRPGRASRRSSARTSAAVGADPFDHGRDERRDPPAGLANGRPGGDQRPRARRGDRPLYAIRDRYGIDLAIVDVGRRRR